MKNNNNKFINRNLYLLVALILLTATIINSCKKDTSNKQQNTITDPAVAQAKNWYESTYATSNTKLNTRAESNNIDFSRHLHPDWDKAVTYSRFDDEVVEIPLDAATSEKMGLGLKNETGTQVYNTSYSHSSFLLIKQLGKYNAYIMTIIADADYLKNDLTRLERNKYNKRDTDFSGAVIYNTPKGIFVNGWTYKNGLITGQIEPNSASSATGGNSQTTQSLKSNTFSQKITLCTEWYQTVTFEGVVQPQTSLGETCVTFDVGGAAGGGSSSGGSSGGTGGGAGGGSNGGSTSSSGGTPCDLTLNNVKLQGKTVVNSLTTHTAVTPIGGFPPPSGNPCPTNNITSVTKTTPNFGMDKNCLNCRIADENFDKVLDYLDSQHLKYTDPYQTSWLIGGVEYAGQNTDIMQPDGKVTHYFSPDFNSDLFQIGIEYTIGISDSETSPSVNPALMANIGDLFIGSAINVVGNGRPTYRPTGSGGAFLTFAQRQALEDADNQRLLNLLQQEDAKDDAAVSPCHGTARNGNVMWPGTAEHWLIQFDYIANNPAALREYIIPGASGKLNGNPGYADIVNPLTNEMFEIKPDNLTGQAAGASEVQLYVAQGNVTCPPPNGGTWTAGKNYATRYLPDPRNPSNLLKASLNSAGVIVYGSVPRNGQQPEAIPVALPENLTEKLKKLSQGVKASPTTMQQQVVTFVRQNPKIIPYLKGAAASIIIASLLEDIASEGIGVLDDWQSFLLARTLWRVANGIVII